MRGRARPGAAGEAGQGVVWQGRQAWMEAGNRGESAAGAGWGARRGARQGAEARHAWRRVARQMDGDERARQAKARRRQGEAGAWHGMGEEQESKQLKTKGES